ncbi:endonuclease domain-containing 1 protein-like [Xyrauchen texanus]|uniref:endonuclease domain-containing 1 protein-like n=1 Tax=Xyrauchen texanus TaxID=154827 RepID=UPI002242A9F8|nr:endonuclease domain-containing 1 protein-like [Xyrauchen texanus]
MMVVIILSAVLMLIFQCAVSDVVDDFDKCSEFFLDNQPPEIPGVLVDSKSADQNHFKLICQGAKDKYTFATFYNTTSRIPVFSAYTYSGKGNFNRDQAKKPWSTEPQLDNSEQATDADYRTDPPNVNRGHLFPVCHAKDVPTAKSTFTLTNAVPQKVSFNGGSWGRMETYTKQLMDSHCLDNNNKVLAYVLTGAVPGTINLNNRVNIPKMMWTAFCCYNSKNQSWFSKAHWAPNVDEIVNQRTIPTVSLINLHDHLKNTWGEGLKLFNDKCLTDEPVNTNLPPPDTECEEEKSFCHQSRPVIFCERSCDHTESVLTEIRKICHS